MKRNGSAVWINGLKTGNGRLETFSKALNGVRYSFAMRFEDAQGTNPEELLAAAHAGCFSMALSGELGKQNISPREIRTTATVSLEKIDQGYEIKSVHLDVHALIERMPGDKTATEQQFQRAAEIAKAGCPVSKLFRAPITMSATLEK